MEHHGSNPKNLVYAIIPARYSSVRLPGKMLLLIAGKPLILHTVDRAREATLVDKVIVATDDSRIFDVVSAAGVATVMTSPEHQSGSDRIAEVARELPEGSIIVNVQGDEPLISPATIDRAVREIMGGDARAERVDLRGTLAGKMPAVQSAPDIVTTFEPIVSVEELENPNIVKIVATDEGRALYFSRSPMPFPREAASNYGGSQRGLTEEPELFSHFKKHTGLYVYRREYLLRFTKLPQTTLEKLEMLEQLRALENDAFIKVVRAESNSIGVDTAEDLARVREILDSVNCEQSIVNSEE